MTIGFAGYEAPSGKTMSYVERLVVTHLHATRWSALFGALIVAFSSNVEALAGVCDHGWTGNVVEENDSFIPPSDRHYTQGIMLSATSGVARPGCQPHDTATNLSNLLFPFSTGGGAVRYGFFFGHSIFTPENLNRRPPDPRDRPYAGWLYVGSHLYRESAQALDKAQISIGLVGPGAQGEEIQNWWHNATADTLGGGQVRGWDAQLRNEPGIILTRERIWRFADEVGEVELDVLPQLNVSLGNVFTYAGAGAMARFGQRVDVDWGPPRIEPALSGLDFINRQNLDDQWFAWYAFAGPEVRLVGRNIFLDGNTFEDSASVDKRFLVADLNAGLAAVISFNGVSARVTGSYTLRTEEFVGQQGNDEFVSIAISIKF